MISITIDLEWCPKVVIEDTLRLLDEAGVPATLFSTHNDEITATNHERALHPNFFEQEDDEEVVVEEIHEIYPSATGIRSHGLYIHSRLRSCYPESLRYESNYIQYLEPEISPHWMHQKIIQFPVYFMDDMWLRTNEGQGHIDIDSLIQPDGLKVFDFHPVHIYLNTSTIASYNEAKEHYQSPEKLRDLRNNEYGVRDLFVHLLEAMETSQEPSAPLGKISDNYAEENPYKLAFKVN